MYKRSDSTGSSASNISVFDWGFKRKNSRESLGSVSGSASERRGSYASGGGDEGRPSRYDPSAMSRIVDLNDLVDDSGEESDDTDIIIGHSSIEGGVTASSVIDASSSNKKRNKRASEASRESYGPGGTGPSKCRHAIVLVALSAIIVGASLAIYGYTMTSGDQNNGVPSQNTNGYLNGSNKKREKHNKEMLEQAERITLACAQSRLEDDRSECHKLCKKNMCCFESGEDSCGDDEEKNCAVYAGCVNLMEGVPLDAADEEEE